MNGTESRTLEGRRPSDDAHHTALCNLWCRLAAKTVKNRGAQELNFCLSAPLPHHWINAGFDGWHGDATIRQSVKAISVNVNSDLTTAILFSPSARADFFCFEPVSHPVDAHNLPNMPGLTLVQPNQSLTATLTFDWSEAIDELFR